MRRLVLALALAASLTTAGVTGAAKTPRPTLKQDRAKLKTIVLRARDVPEGFTLVTARFFTPAEIALQGTWSARQLKAWGYKAGYEVQFDRAVDNSRVAQISSDAGVYRSVPGARSALAANGAACQRGLWSELALGRPLGDGAHLCTLETSLGETDVQVFLLVWRIGRWKGAITLSGVKGAFTVADVFALGARQAARMRART